MCQLVCIFEHPKTKASIIGVSLVAFSNTPKPRPASFVSACWHFRTPQNQGQHHRCQLGCIFEHPTPRPASFVSACWHFRTPQNHGQHHRCQLGCIVEHPKTKASIIGVSLFAFSNTPKPRPASSVSAWLHFRTPPKPRPASSVSAWLHFRTPQNQGQHHRCQLVCIFEHPKTKASIICVSLFAFSNTPKPRPASSVSACLHFRTPQNQGQHHLCQLVCIFEHPKTKASIIGVSLFAFSNTPKPRPASFVSACLHFRTPQKQGQHHRCQLVCIFEHPKTKASIIGVSLFAFSNTPKPRPASFGVSLFAFSNTPKPRPASSVSACLHFRTPQNQGQHHRCQLGCIVEHPKTKASIIGVSLVAFSNTPKPRPASSVSAWLHFRTPQNQGQHHRCQLVCIFEHPKTRPASSVSAWLHFRTPHTKASIIRVSLFAFSKTPKPRPASSVSACLHFPTPQNQGQHHRCQLVCIFEHLKTKASIIGVSLFAFSNTPKPRPASFVSACLHFRTPQNQGQQSFGVSLFAFSNTPKPRPSSVSAWFAFSNTPKPRPA